MFGWYQARETRECKHRFRPRYSKRTPKWINESASLTFEGVMPFEQIYECDVCERCGQIVKMEAST